MISPSPAIDLLLEKMGVELKTEAVLFLHDSGQILARHGKLQEHEYPTVAALVAGMVAAGTSLMNAAKEVIRTEEDRKRFSCEYRDGGIYAVAVGQDYWVASVYKEILNPGQLRMRLRSYAEMLDKLCTPQTLTTKVGIISAPVSDELGHHFENITDEEIERIFHPKL